MLKAENDRLAEALIRILRNHEDPQAVYATAVAALGPNQATQALLESGVVHVLARGGLVAGPDAPDAEKGAR